MGVGGETDDVIETPDKLSFQCSWQEKQSQFDYNIFERPPRKTGDMKLHGALLCT